MKKEEIDQILKELKNIEGDENRESFFQKHKYSLLLALVGGTAGRSFNFIS